jgi:hypothetical protein
MEKLYLDEFDIDGKQRVLSLVADYLLGKEQLPLLMQRYEDMLFNYNNYVQDYCTGERKPWVFSENLKPFKGYKDTTAVPIPISHPKFKTLRNLYKNQAECDKSAWGLDLPIWFNLANSKQRIMIVAQDPLRNPEFYADCPDVVCSTPFGLSDAAHREKARGGMRINLLVKHLIENDFGVYLTDIMKFYLRAKANPPYKASNEILDDYSTILKAEIDIIRPSHIIALGNKSIRALSKMGINNVIIMPHFSGAAQGAIKKFFLEKHLINEPRKLSIIEQVALYTTYIIKETEHFIQIPRQS